MSVIDVREDDLLLSALVIAELVLLDFSGFDVLAKSSDVYFIAVSGGEGVELPMRPPPVVEDKAGRSVIVVDETVATWTFWCRRRSLGYLKPLSH